MRHKDKVKLARKMSGLQHGMFESKAWIDRKIAIEKRVEKRNKHELQG